MPKFKPLPPLERLNKLLEVVDIPPDKYGIWSGLVWKVNRGRTAKVNSVAGYPDLTPSNPNRINWRVRINGVQYLASRIIYYMTYGEDPGETQVDHKDQNWLNNNSCNLRLDIDGNIQKVNTPKQRNNTSGVMGVSWHKTRRKWQASVQINGKQNHLGYFTCKIEAARAVRNKWIDLDWDKLGRKLPDLDKIECDCRRCLINS